MGKLGPFKTTIGSLPSLTNASSIIPAAVLSLLVSLLFAASYPWLTILFGPRRDLRRAYGFEDFYWVLAFSFVIAFVIFVVLCLAGWLFGPGFRWLFVPQTGDDAPGLLRKLALRWPLGDGLHFPLVTVGETAGEKPALVVSGRENRSSSLLASRSPRRRARRRTRSRSKSLPSTCFASGGASAAPRAPSRSPIAPTTSRNRSFGGRKRSRPSRDPT